MVRSTTYVGNQCHKLRAVNKVNVKGLQSSRNAKAELTAEVFCGYPACSCFDMALLHLKVTYLKAICKHSYVVLSAERIRLC